MFNEAKKSLECNLSEKLVSPFWGAFILSWLVCNWKVWYVTFFVDSSLLLQLRGILKIDYITSIYSWSSYWNCLLNLFHLLIFPIISSYLIIFQLPKITRYYYEKSLDFENECRIIKEKKEKAFLKAREEKLDVEKDVLVKEREVKVIKLEKTQEEIWDDEYEKFKKSKYFLDFEAIKKAYYSGNRWADTIPVDIKVYCDTNKIIEIIQLNGNEKIDLTDKGKYFIKRYMD